MFSFLLFASAALWLIILILPWQPYTTKESWEADPLDQSDIKLDDVTVLIPARNEEKVIERTLSSVLKQGDELKVIVVNDNSDDNTYEIAANVLSGRGLVINADEHPSGWTGKLWALEQGRQYVKTPVTMLLDADIELSDSVVKGLRKRFELEHYSLISLMAKPSLNHFWEKMLMPSFIYFFKLLYPFKLANSDNKLVAAAAGGCIMAKTEVFKQIGGFGSIRDALIDDCTLARKVKEKGFRTWLGLTRSVKSIRPYSGLPEIWNMVARTAYNQLSYSIVLLMFCTILMVIAFLMPPTGLLTAVLAMNETYFQVSLITAGLMLLTYFPVIRFYRISPFYTLFLPLSGFMFLLMTWTSAMRYWQGEHVRWRGRVEKRDP